MSTMDQASNGENKDSFSNLFHTKKLAFRFILLAVENKTIRAWDVWVFVTSSI